MRPTATGATRTRVTRTICADPTSTALLLAGPAAVDLWPGVRRVGEVGGRVLVEAELAEAATAATVRALPPQRTPTSYVTKFAFVGPSLPATDGELTLAYAPGSDSPATSAVLTLDSTDLDGSLLNRYDLTVMAERFLDNLARAAEERCRAA
ncbi:MAG: hypothetical protein JWN77_952 [Frankiales bacterium]|jgi:hypothetical protein|nr:hypothetical protein [Frankiales bacterium]